MFAREIKLSAQKFLSALSQSLFLCFSFLFLFFILLLCVGFLFLSFCFLSFYFLSFCFFLFSSSFFSVSLLSVFSCLSDFYLYQLICRSVYFSHSFYLTNCYKFHVQHFNVLLCILKQIANDCKIYIIHNLKLLQAFN